MAYEGRSQEATADPGRYQKYYIVDNGKQQLVTSLMTHITLLSLVKHTTWSYTRFSSYKDYFFCKDILAHIYLHTNNFSLQFKYHHHFLLNNKCLFCFCCSKFLVNIICIIVSILLAGLVLFIPSFHCVSYLIGGQLIEFYPLYNKSSMNPAAIFLILQQIHMMNLRWID